MTKILVMQEEISFYDYDDEKKKKTPIKTSVFVKRITCLHLNNVGYIEEPIKIPSSFFPYFIYFFFFCCAYTSELFRYLDALIFYENHLNYSHARYEPKITFSILNILLVIYLIAKMLRNSNTIIQKRNICYPF